MISIRVQTVITGGEASITGMADAKEAVGLARKLMPVRYRLQLKRFLAARSARN